MKVKNSNFVDYVKIFCRSGKGGAGSTHFLRDRNTAKGGPDGGDWRIIAYYPGSTFYAESTDNITHEVHYKEKVIILYLTLLQTFQV